MIQIGDQVCTDEQEETIRFAIEMLNTELRFSDYPGKEKYIKGIRELREMFDKERNR